MKQLTEIKRIRFSSDLWKKLDKLKDYNLKKTDFIRIAIEEKLIRDIPKLKLEKETFTYPF